MLDKLLNFAKMSTKNKVMSEVLKTLKTDIDLCQELMEHPLKKQTAIKELLKEMKDICEKGLTK